jgi:HK97 family phage major capsid protein
MPEVLDLSGAVAEHEKISRELISHRSRLNALMETSAKADGGYGLTDTASRDLNWLTGDIERLERDKQAREMDIIKMRNADALHRLSREPAPQTVALHARAENGDGQKNGATKTYASMGEALVNLPEYKSWDAVGRGRQTIGFDWDLSSLKAALVSTGLTSYERRPDVIGVLHQPMTIEALLGRAETNATTVRILRETSPRSHTVAAVAESVAKPEQLFAYTEVDFPVKKFAGYTKLSDELRSDYPAVMSHVNDQLPFEVQRVAEQAILTGAGGTSVTGILNTANIQTQARATDTNADAIYKALMKIMSVAFMDPDGIVIHPTNWQDIRLLKETTGPYIWGHPSVVGPTTLFGYPVVITSAITLGTALVGAFRRSAQVYNREGVRVEMTNTDQDDFITNRITVRAERRFALATPYPSGFCTVTGLSP